MSNDEDILGKFRKFEAEAFDYEEAMNSNNITQDDVDELREMSISSEFVPKALLDKVFLLFLITCENNKDKSLNLLHNYCKLKKETPEFFAKRDFESEEIQQALNNQIYATLPPTPNNCNLILHKLSNYEPKNYVFDAAEKTFLMTIGEWKFEDYQIEVFVIKIFTIHYQFSQTSEARLYKEGPKNGVIFLWDMGGARIGHVFQPKITSIRKLIKLVDEGCPFKIQEIHVLNTQPFLDLVLGKKI